MFEVSVLKGQSGKQSMIILMDDLFPECKELTKDTNLSRLSCWTIPGSCHKGSYTNCMGVLVERAYRIFDAMADLELMILHWSAPHPGAPGNERRWGLIIERDENSQMSVSPLNNWAVKSIEKRLGNRFEINMEL